MPGRPSGKEEPALWDRRPPDILQSFGLFRGVSFFQIFFLSLHMALPGSQPQALEARQLRHPLGLTQSVSVSLLKICSRRWRLGGCPAQGSVRPWTIPL